MIPIAFDCETFLIGPGAVLPKMVCASFAWRDSEGTMQTALFGNSPVDELPDKLLAVLTNPDYKIITHNGAFDWGVAMASYPQLTTAIFDAITSGRCTDTLWREKLLNLSTTGKLDYFRLPDGTSRPISYSLASLVHDYLDLDISGDKTKEDAWRLNYNVLDGWQAEDYPDEAARYAKADAELTLRVYEAQEARKERSAGVSSTQTEEFQLASSFALNLMTAWGIEVNPEAVAQMRAELETLLGENENLLVGSGILVQGTPATYMLRSGKPVLDRKAMKDAGIKVPKDALKFAAGTDPAVMISQLEERGLIIKRKAAKPGKIDTKKLQALAAQVFQALGEIPEMTKGGSREPQIVLNAEVQRHLAKHDETMQQYHLRKSLQKLLTNQLPVLESGAVIHPNFDVLKETGRTSSYGGGRKPLYPSANIQQVPNEIRGFDPRRCYRPRAGTVFFDVDYTALELACVGQITYDLFGQSVHLTRYNDGYDLHAYLGSQLAVRADDGIAGEFAQGCREQGIISDPVEVYNAFMLCKGSDTEAVSAFYEHYRKFAKPVGLGFPGGLGAATMVDFARATYGVDLTEEQAAEFKEMWKEVYPEMPLYFDWLEGQRDEYNDKDGEALYYYVTPFGMIRRGATFCAGANGKAMQSPGAEGFKAACIMVQRECYDPSMESVLFGCRPTKPIHDQIVGETTTDQSKWHDQAMRVRDIMCDAMRGPLPDINMRSDEAHLTAVWTKKSKPVFDENQRLIPWTPE